MGRPHLQEESEFESLFARIGRKGNEFTQWPKLSELSLDYAYTRAINGENLADIDVGSPAGFALGQLASPIPIDIQP